MAIIIDGKKTSADIRAEIKKEAEILKEKYGIIPGLAVIIVGQDPASKIYVKNKHKGCIESGMHSEVHELPDSTSESELLSLIDTLNKRSDIHGILVQLPLPSHIDEEDIIAAIDPQKDVDGFHPINVGKLSIGKPGIMPCTPAGIIELLKRYNVEIAGKECVVVGRSNIVGKPTAMALLANDGTVTICHRKTKDLREKCQKADILVVATGNPKFITADMVKPGAVIVDIGISRTSEGKTVGDVDFESVAPIASAITPVPGGVGPMTITMLLKNTLESAKKQCTENK